MNPEPVASDTARVFFALWPDEAVRQELARAGKLLHGACGGRITRQENLHLTLAFLGDVQRNRLDALREAAATVRAPAHVLKVEPLGLRLIDEVEYYENVLGELESSAGHPIEVVEDYGMDRGEEASVGFFRLFQELMQGPRAPSSPTKPYIALALRWGRLFRGVAKTICLPRTSWRCRTSSRWWMRSSLTRWPVRWCFGSTVRAVRRKYRI